MDLNSSTCPKRKGIEKDHCTLACKLPVNPLCFWSLKYLIMSCVFLFNYIIGMNNFILLIATFKGSEYNCDFDSRLQLRIVWIFNTQDTRLKNT